MKLARSLAFLVLVALAPIFAHAGGVTLSYTAPTTCADGSALTNCPTTGYEVLTAASATATSATLETVGPTVTTRNYANLTPGTYCYSVKTVSNTVKSAESVRACADVPSLPPKAPAGITVTVNVTISTP